MWTPLVVPFLATLALPVSALPEPPTKVLAARQSVVTPPPCKAINPPPSAAETEQRFNKFADEFLVKKNLTAAFEFISSTYINHNPFADDGPNAALDFLGPVWPSTQITVLRTEYIDPQGFLNYNASGIGTVVDRFRWEAGCIVEHSQWLMDPLFIAVGSRRGIPWRRIEHDNDIGTSHELERHRRPKASGDEWSVKEVLASATKMKICSSLFDSGKSFHVRRGG